MKPQTTQRFALGMLFVVGLTGIGQRSIASAQAERPSFTIRVRNDAGVESETLEEAEQAAGKIFREAGVGCRWISVPSTASLPKSGVEEEFSGRSDVRVNVLSREMAERLKLPGMVNGLAPGAGPGRFLVYVLYERIQGVAQREVQRQADAEGRGKPTRRATEGQILGEVFAHEIGHIMLNLAEHTRTGIMRGDWDLHDLSDIAEGYLGFTKQQSRVIQAEVARRAREQDVVESQLSADRSAAFVAAGQ